MSLFAEELELTLAHVGLGTLNESAVLPLFATAQAHRLVDGTGHSLRDVADANGAQLYPAYYFMALRVPESHLLERYRLWDRVTIAADVGLYGKLVLDTTCVVAPAGAVPARETWDELPTLRSGSLFTLDRTGAVAVPKPGAIAALDKRTDKPAALDRVREVRQHGRIARHDPLPLVVPPITVPVWLGEDVAAGHNLMFATYLALMDRAEQTALAETLWPPVPLPLLLGRMTVERETYWLNHTQGFRRARAEVRAHIEVRTPEPLGGLATPRLALGTVTTEVELYEDGTGLLLAVTRAKKLITVAQDDGHLQQELQRFASRA